MRQNSLSLGSIRGLGVVLISVALCDIHVSVISPRSHNHAAKLGFGFGGRALWRLQDESADFVAVAGSGFPRKRHRLNSRNTIDRSQRLEIFFVFTVRDLSFIWQTYSYSAYDRCLPFLGQTILKKLYRLHRNDDFVLEVRVKSRLGLICNHHVVFSLFLSVHSVCFMFLFNFLFLCLPPLTQVNLLFRYWRVTTHFRRRRLRLNPYMSVSYGVDCCCS